MTRIARMDVSTVAPLRPPAKGVGVSTVTPLSAIARGAALLRGDQTAGLTPGGTWAVVVRLVDEDGHVGTGTCGYGNPSAVAVLEQFAPLVVGRDVTEITDVWESLYRSTLNIGRRGTVIHAISGVDIAMWDLLGRRLGVPCHVLLGGAVRDRQPAYASWLYATEDLDALAAEAAGYAAAGFGAVKQRLAGGPQDGIRGIRRNVELIRTVQEAVGPDVEVMADAYMGWDLAFAVRCIHAIEDAGLRLRWLEEPLIPDDVRNLARLRREVSTPIAAGEHEATRYGFRDLLASEAVDVIQPDVNRLGGITEGRRVWALGESYGVEVIAHLGAAHNLQLSVASHATPLVEWMPPPAPGADPDEDQLLWTLFDDAKELVDGHFEIPQGPGLGVDVDQAQLVPAFSVGDPAAGERPLFEVAGG